MNAKHEGYIFGATYRDNITWFTGVCIAHVEYMNGTQQTLLQPLATEPSNFPDDAWIDDDRLTLLTEPVGA